MFIIRADGSIVARNKGLLSGKFDDLELNPGDSLIVPEMVHQDLETAGIPRLVPDLHKLRPGRSSSKRTPVIEALT